ncbi:TetR/AcrR family transcriptional regulator [Aliikangiella coralliicola]|uniref:TetR/AcrR family transcriptional regulator n=1 Tax=Aliikangiella coralliicola TaxID=2592383 RepID=A0A545UJ60_9GAMM|nr:TetR/AcrR family transcriptional regulator [Aliikangiella coralliicola]TQV89495.1 TetR/AcrR family transcriptional regulator [Aliikangiella coralliicola]
MARPSVKEQRQAQILDAYEACVARYGIEGATLERIAEQAGLARALIRHNIGNRDELIDALVERFIKQTRQEIDEMMDELPKRNRLKVLTEWLFDPAHSDTQFVLVSDALFMAAINDPVLADKMRKWTMEFILAIEKLITDDYPDTDKKLVSAVAAGIVGIYFNVESLTPLGKLDKLAKDSKQAVLLLINLLK